MRKKRKSQLSESDLDNPIETNRVVVARSPLGKGQAAIDLDSSGEVQHFDLFAWDRINAAVYRILMDGKKEVIINFRRPKKRKQRK